MDEHYEHYKKKTNIPYDFSILEDEDKFDPEVWGPHYWIFLHTVSYTYPLHPTAVTKRKYYDLINNFSLFIPNQKIGNDFNKLLDNFPVTPYLVNRDSFIRWVHFIHNQINKKLNKPEISLQEALKIYYLKYENNYVRDAKLQSWKKKYLSIFFVVFIFFIILTTYNI